MIRSTIALAILVCGFPAPALQDDGSKDNPYDRDPGHLWNRIHRQLSTWSGEGLSPEVRYQPDPLLWPARKHHLDGASQLKAAPLLEEFLKTNGEKLIEDPLKRALFQYDLWLIFDWSASPDEEASPEIRDLQRKLVAVMRRVALSPEQIKKLPDTLAAAASSKEFPRAQLPADLDEKEGPWIRLASKYEDGLPLARSHVAFNGGRASFTIYVRIAGGREATLKWLGRLPKNVTGEGDHPPILAPGSQVALVRRLMLIDGAGLIAPTRVAETVQVRTYLDPPKGELAEEPRAPWQSFAMFKLNRRALLSGKPGLRALAKDEGEPAFIIWMGNEKASQNEKILHSCVECHMGNGLSSMPSLAPNFLTRAHKNSAGDAYEPPRWTFRAPEFPASELDVEFEAVAWKREQYSWGLLKGLWDSPR